MIQTAMARYADDEYEDLDEYEEDGEEEEGDYEEEYEQEETHEPSPEELGYLELRQKLKENIRKKMKKELGTATSSRTIKSSSSKDSFGSFFGPSQPVIAQRVIQESKALLENPELAAKVLRANNAANGKVHASNSVRPKPSSSIHAPKVSNVVKTKIQVLKNTRDYSFLLSDDADVPAPSKASLPKKSPAPNSDSRPAQFVPRDRNPSSNNIGRKLPNSRDERRPLPGGGVSHNQLKPKAGVQKNVSASKQNQPAREVKKEPIRSNGNVRGGQPLAPKNLPLKSSTCTTERKASTLGVKRPMSNLPRPNPSKLQPSNSKQAALVQKRIPQESSKPRMLPKPAMQSSRPPVAMQKHAVPSSRPQVVMQKRVLPSSRPQIKQPPAKNPAQRPAKRPKRRDEEEEGTDDFRLEIRKLFRYNPERYKDDDDDGSNMVANFDDCLEEERRSALFGRKEDEEELRKLEEEERRERMKKQAKKRKMIER